jgi:hypothetical protein
LIIFSGGLKKQLNMKTILFDSFFIGEKCMFVLAAQSSNSGNNQLEEDVSDVLLPMDDISFPTEDIECREQLINSRRRISTTMRYMKKQMSEACSYKKGALCAEMIGKRLHPRRKLGDYTTEDDVLMRKFFSFSMIFFENFLFLTFIFLFSN